MSPQSCSSEPWQQSLNAFFSTVFILDNVLVVKFYFMSKKPKAFALPDPDLFSDVEGIPAPQNPKGPFVIQFTEEYDRAMSIFREFLAKDELSPRALQLCNVLCQKLTSDCTVWWFRERVLEKIGYDFEEELRFVDKLIKSQPKPYQLWNHRQWLVWRCENPPDHTKFFDKVIGEDAKNFHAWSYFCKFADKFGQEDWLLERTKGSILHDPTNNSPWSARYHVIERKGAVSSEELQFALDLLFMWPGSEPICSYVRGLLRIDKSDKVIATIEEVLEKVAARTMNRHLMGLIAYVAELKGDMAKYDEFIERIGKADFLRKKFWPLMKSDSHRFESIS